MGPGWCAPSAPQRHPPTEAGAFQAPVAPARGAEGAHQVPLARALVALALLALLALRAPFWPLSSFGHVHEPPQKQTQASEHTTWSALLSRGEWLHQQLRVLPKRRVEQSVSAATPGVFPGKPVSARNAFCQPVPGSAGCYAVVGKLLKPGIHVALTHLKTLILTDRADSVVYGPLQPVTRGLEVDLSDLTNGITPSIQRELHIGANIVCSTGQILPDGSLLSIGGAYSAGADATQTIRVFSPCSNRTCDWSVLGNMTTRRWYATSQIMPDGRVLVVGGASTLYGVNINDKSSDNPTVEYWPKKTGEPGNYFLQFLKTQLPYNLYPFVHVLPSGRVFIFAGQGYTLFDSTTNKEVPGSYPSLKSVDDIPGWKYHVPVFRNYPVTATNVLFPLSSANGYAAEIMLCGGGNIMAVRGKDDGRRGGLVPAEEYCWRIQPEVAKPKWTRELMCNYPSCNTTLRRVMGEAVLLVDGSVLILSGAGRGFMGLQPWYAQAPVLTPLLYFPQNHSWFKQPLGSSTVPRVYHSTALLLYDASVLVAGSNPNPHVVLSGPLPTELRAEIFYPHYLWTGLAQPQLLTVPPVIPVASTFSVAFLTPQNSSLPFLQRFSAVLINPGYSTHASRHGMRNVVVDILSVYQANDTTFMASLRAPPSLNHAPPGMYWFHILDNGVPNVSGIPTNVTASISSGQGQSAMRRATQAAKHQASYMRHWWQRRRSHRA